MLQPRGERRARTPGRHRGAISGPARPAGEKAAARRRELGSSVRERLAEHLQADADAIYKVFADAIKAGDYKAAESALNQEFGRPLQEGGEHGSSGVTIHIESAFIAPKPAE